MLLKYLTGDKWNSHNQVDYKHIKGINRRGLKDTWSFPGHLRATLGRHWLFCSSSEAVRGDKPGLATEL